MKREYAKPDILFESFSLATTIAGDCEVKTNTPAQRTCGLPSSGLGTVFTTNMVDICTFRVPDGTFKGPGSNDGICYDVPTANNNLFNS